MGTSIKLIYTYFKFLSSITDRQVSLIYKKKAYSFSTPRCGRGDHGSIPCLGKFFVLFRKVFIYSSDETRYFLCDKRCV
jgi:hypothetical protein